MTSVQRSSIEQVDLTLDDECNEQVDIERLARNFVLGMSVSWQVVQT